jgi:hypothetical protein
MLPAACTCWKFAGGSRLACSFESDAALPVTVVPNNEPIVTPR